MKGQNMQLCTIPKCGKKSIAGLHKGHGKCQYHWNVLLYGKEWADHVAHDPRKETDCNICKINDSVEVQEGAI